MKLLKVKKQDARPSIRIKAAGNVFVEVYKDNKGYFYRIDVPGATDFVSKERFENQDKARLAGVTHAKKFIGKVKGDQKKADGTAFDNCRKAAYRAAECLQGAHWSLNAIAKWAKDLDLHEAEEVLEIFNSDDIVRAKEMSSKLEKAKKALEAAG